MKRIIFLAALLTTVTLGMTLPAAAGPSVPNYINFQGRLADNTGNPVADGAYSVRFAVFALPVGGSQLWGQITTQNTVGGLFTQILGPFPDTLFQGYDSLFLEVIVEGEAQSPRTRLTSNPYSQVANNLEVRSTGISSPDTVAIRTFPFGHRISTYGSDGQEQVRIWGESYGEIYLHDADPTNDRTVVLKANPTTGGELELNNTNGDLTIDLLGGQSQISTYDNGNLTIDLLGGSSQISTYGSDGQEQIRLFGPSWGEILLHDPDVTNDRTVKLTANNSAGGELELTDDNGHLTIDLHGGLTGDASVAIPNDAINALEMLNEPGVASNTGTTNIIMDGTVQTLLSRTITVPASGWVLVIGTASILLTHANLTPTFGSFGVSDVAGSFPANQEAEVALSNSAPSGNYAQTVTSHGLFSVSAGGNTFYFIGQEGSGNLTVHDRQLTLVYYPTAYGTVTPTLAASPGLLLEPNIRGLALTAADIAAERAEAEQFNAERLARELAQVRSEMEALKKEVREQKGQGQTIDD